MECTGCNRSSQAGVGWGGRDLMEWSVSCFSDVRDKFPVR